MVDSRRQAAGGTATEPPRAGSSSAATRGSFGNHFWRGSSPREEGSTAAAGSRRTRVPNVPSQCRWRWRLPMFRGASLRVPSVNVWGAGGGADPVRTRFSGSLSSGGHSATRPPARRTARAASRSFFWGASSARIAFGDPTRALRRTRSCASSPRSRSRRPGRQEEVSPLLK